MTAASKFQFQRKCLDNGLVLLISENQRVPLISLNGFVLVGADRNPLDKPGLASMTLSLLDEGTEKYDAHQLAAIIEDSGGSLSIFSQKELSGINLEIKSEDVKMGLELVAEMLWRPVFPEDRFTIEQEKVLNHIQAIDDNPQLVASNRFNHWIYQGCPLQFPILGTTGSLSAMHIEEVRSFYRKNFAPGNTILVIVGAVNADQTAERIEKKFSSWTNPQFQGAEIPLLKKQDQPIFDEHFMDKEQLNIFIGHLGITRNNPDYYPLQVLDVILGSGPGFASRIPGKLRDEQGLAYSTYSDISGSSGIYPGRFVAFISTSPENRERALEGLLFEIKNLVRDGITQEELEMAQDFLTGNFVFEFQSNGNIARFLLGTELFNLGGDYLHRYPQIIRRITREEVNRVARQYLDTVNYTTVIVGPKV